MAIRNGFSRATTAIVDSNITTLITGVVLYVIGTDQIKGFAITLILGIIMSMYTAIFCSRAIFDIAERRRWIKSLKMSHLFGETNFDFLRQTAWAVTLSAVLIAVGAVAVWQRGTEILNIDFTGGTAVTMVFLDEHRTPFNDVRSTLEQTELVDKNLTVVERGGTRTRYTVTSTIASVAEVQEILEEAFAGKLKTYDVQVTDVRSEDSAGSVATLEVNSGPGYEEEPGVGHDPLMARLESALAAVDREGLEPALDAPGFQPGSSAPHKTWTVHLGLDPDEARSVLEAMAADMSSQAMFPLSNKIGGSVAGNLQVQATYAVLISIIGIVGYLWLRFQKVTYGLAAVLAIVHDVLVTIGMIAVSPYILRAVPAVASALQIDAFQIGLTVVAALLTIIGYSLNDTIVIFDRIREVKGKSPQLTAQMINTSMNQTLSRTILTSATTLLVVVILYFFGGAGIHDFSFSLVVGVIAGSYSTMFIASPALLAMSGNRRRTASVKTDTQAA
jgi:SecD/SecF fusion protein